LGTEPEDFTDDLYELIRRGAQRSAAAVVPLIDPAPNTVVDVGCGEGWWGAEFAKRGTDVLGLDNAADPVIPSVTADLTKPLPDVGPFDLAICLEVAEHLAPERAESFIAELCALAPLVLFSAAIPGQGGIGHVNERWPAYWVALFGDSGFTCSGALRWRIWDDERVENWYRQNLLVAAREPKRFPQWFDTPLAAVHPVVHPVLYESIVAETERV
jgi:SAM-dependent methyltransferase